MTYFSTCTGCGVARSDCQTLIAVKKAIAGLRITTVRHRCAQREPMYRPGDAVWIKTVAWQGGDEEPPLCEFPGVFIEQKQRKAIAFIKPGSLDGSGDEVFSTDGRGYVKVPLSRLILDPAWAFAKTYVLQRGFLDGPEGLTIAQMAAFYTFLKYSKARNMS